MCLMQKMPIQMWLCLYKSALSHGSMPVQAKANHSQLDVIPVELSTLNALELRLISLRVSFMKMVALPCPHSQNQLLSSKLKYKSHYMYDYMFLLKSLWKHYIDSKANNPLYADVNVNEHWVDESMADDCHLLTCLVMLPETNSLDCDHSSTDLILQDHVQKDSTAKELSRSAGRASYTASALPSSCNWSNWRSFSRSDHLPISAYFSSNS